jgi:phage terminase large subunit
MSTQTIERTYVPRGAARDVFRRRDPEVLIAGPAGTGKSRAALEKVHAVCLATPNVRALIVRKTLVSLTSTGLVTYREHVAAEAIASRIVFWYGGSGEKPAAYIYSNGSTITVGGMDRPDKVMSSEYDIIYVQEATELTLEDWEKLKTRLRNGRISFQQLLADCNPQTPTHWLNKRCQDGKCVMLYGKHEDNPVLYDDSGALTVRGAEYMSALDNLTGVRYLRLRKGIWAAAEGIIYEGWDDAVHISDRKTLPRDWVRYWAIDFGFNHPFVWQQWAVDEDGRLWLEHEIYQSKRLVEDHARRILEVVTTQKGAWRYPRPRAIICDHDAEDRATLERHLGMSTVGATKTVSDGIQAVAARLKVQPDGKPRLAALRTALVERDESLASIGHPLGLAQEVPGYIWAPGKDGQPAKEEPVKVMDDACDAMRYMVAQLDVKRRARADRYVG